MLSEISWFKLVGAPVLLKYWKPQNGKHALLTGQKNRRLLFFSGFIQSKKVTASKNIFSRKDCTEYRCRRTVIPWYMLGCLEHRTGIEKSRVQTPLKSWFYISSFIRNCINCVHIFIWFIGESIKFAATAPLRKVSTSCSLPESEGLLSILLKDLHYEQLLKMVSDSFCSEAI